MLIFELIKYKLIYIYICVKRLSPQVRTKHLVYIEFLGLQISESLASRSDLDLKFLNPRS